ncbi:hypothetical protein EON64_11795 [archaeon]|nr:MAG: hypothetical protein EON64_11795 [archaeon]
MPGKYSSSCLALLRKAHVLKLPHCCFAGITGLSLDEIRADFQDVTLQQPASDTDTDGSVLSEDIMPSVYPVKPRRTAGKVDRTVTLLETRTADPFSM